nr:late expression factor 10 [Buzura suppressaria nucleopolyhedrovirus]
MASNDENSVFDMITKNNLELLNGTYLMLNVVDKECGQIQTMCIGKIDSFQTHQEIKNDVSTSSVTSELSND